MRKLFITLIAIVSISGVAAFAQLAAPTIKVTSSNDASAVPPNYYTSVAVIFNNYVPGTGFICWTENGVVPTATVPGTCDAGTNSYDASTFTNITLATSGQTIQAIATQAGQVNSSATSNGPVTIIGPPVVFSLGTGRYVGNQSVSLSVLPGAQVPSVTYYICYTTDGTTPTTTTPGGTCGGANASTQTYSGPITIAAAAPGEMVNALVSVSGLANGSVASNIYTILPTRSAITWYVRPDGGSRFSTGQPTGQCNGMYDASYASTGGTGTNQNCAFNDVRYLWQDRSYTTGYYNGTAAYPSWGWVIAGGDTAIIRGSIGTGVSYRVGYNNNGTTTYDGFGIAGDPGASGSPPPPSGTVSQPTQILGENYAACTSPTAKTQIHGGYGAGSVLALQGSSNVNLKCLDITDFTQCTIVGGTGSFYPSACNKSAPYDDYAENGITTDQASANILLQDLNIHGLTLDALGGPIGGLVTMTRVAANYNGATAWNFDNGGDQPNSIDSSIVASYVTMEGNGCNEEYPIVHQFPAISCYNIDSGGFGDSWSGQDTPMANFTCDHCQMIYNTKDGFIGPHVAITNLSITNSASYGNLGQQWKWGSSASGATQVFENNITGGNCSRFSASAGPIPGMNTNVTYYPAALPTSGTYIALPSVCRAAGDVFAFPVTPGSSYLFANNTVYAYSATLFDINNLCGSCSTTSIVFRNNVFLGYTSTAESALPGLFYAAAAPIVSDHNIEYNLRYGDCPVTGVSTILCVSPQLVNQPTGTGATFVESELDNFNFNLTSTSPAIGSGVAISGLTTDYNGRPYANPPSMGAAEFSTATLVSVAVTPNPGSVSAGSTLTMTCTSTFSDSSTAPCSSPTWTSSTTSFGTVNSSGVVMGVAAGITTITAASGGISGSSSVTVSASARTLVSISVTPNPGSITSIGSTLAMICTATYSDSSTGACVSPAWTSAAPSKATVNASTGIVTAVATGSSVITATIGSISGSSTVNISAGTTIQFMMGGKVIFSGTVVVH